MKWSSGTFSWWLLLSAFLVLGSPSWSQQAIAPPLPKQSSQQLISQLQADLKAASVLVAQLKQSEVLHLSSLAALQQQYNQASQALQAAQQALGEASQSSQQTSAQLEAMQTNLTSLTQSLNATKASLASYKSDTDTTILNLEIERDGWKYLAIGGAVLGVAGVIYGLTR